MSTGLRRLLSTRQALRLSLSLSARPLSSLAVLPSCRAVAHRQEFSRSQVASSRLFTPPPSFATSRRFAAASASDDVVIEVTDATFAEKVEKNPLPVVLDCYADWCGPCRTLTLILEAEVRKMDGKVVLAKLDVDQASAVPAKLGVTAIPAVFVYYNGKVLGDFKGVQPTGYIRKIIHDAADLAGK